MRRGGRRVPRKAAYERAWAAGTMFADPYAPVLPGPGPGEPPIEPPPEDPPFSADSTLITADSTTRTADEVP